MTDILERLNGYNPPDRTIDDQRQIAQDIADAAATIAAQAARIKELEVEESRLREIIDVTLETRIAALTAERDALKRLYEELLLHLADPPLIVIDGKAP